MPYNPHFPLAEVIETKTYPHARTLRTSYSQKRWDTYNTIAGRPPVVEPKPHVGLFDYLTLYIPTSLFFLMVWCYENAGRYFPATLLLIPMIIINIPLLITRVVISAAATILFSPVTAIVHGISRLFAQQSHNDALNLEGDTKQGKKSLGQFLQETNMDIEELNITVKKKPMEEISGKSPRFSQANYYQLMFRQKAIGPSSGSVYAAEFLNGVRDDSHAPFSVEIEISKDDPGVVKQAQNIHALFRLNVGDVVANIEDESARLSPTEKSEILAI